jgi:hypothetical protein
MRMWARRIQRRGRGCGGRAVQREGSVDTIGVSGGETPLCPTGNGSKITGSVNASNANLGIKSLLLIDGRLH